MEEEKKCKKGHTSSKVPFINFFSSFGRRKRILNERTISSNSFRRCHNSKVNTKVFLEIPSFSKVEVKILEAIRRKEETGRKKQLIN